MMCEKIMVMVYNMYYVCVLVIVSPLVQHTHVIHIIVMVIISVWDTVYVFNGSGDGSGASACVCSVCVCVTHSVTASVLACPLVHEAKHCVAPNEIPPYNDLKDAKSPACYPESRCRCSGHQDWSQELQACG
eukprot:m.155687 g.155687  ORF g.155687 m.155687 type:complete len:132 (+) comp30950_c0_seq1:303-698(+)